MYIYTCSLITVCIMAGHRGTHSFIDWGYCINSWDMYVSKVQDGPFHFRGENYDKPSNLGYPIGTNMWHKNAKTSNTIIIGKSSTIEI